MASYNMVSSIIRGEKGRYRLLKHIASGGMGSVYLGLNLRNGELVAVKIPKPIPIAVKKSEFEADLLSALDHRNIVRFIDKSYAGGVPVIVEEFIDGWTLEDAVRESGPLEPDRVKAIISSVLLALDYLHSMNIVHRDVKPRNIMIDRALTPGSIKLIDLGTATYYNVSGLDEVVLSSGGYTAPEQYLYHALPQSDLWSVAALAFYLLTGRHPQHFIGPNYYYRPTKPPDPALAGIDVPEGLRAFILKGMSWHVLDRFLSAREALDFLEMGPFIYNEPTMEVMGVKIRLRTPIVVFGRMTRSATPSVKSSSTTLSTRPESLKIEKARVRVFVEGDVTYVRVLDPYLWISLNHFELRYHKGRWCIRDLGSTNRTAVVTRESIIELWRGRRVSSQCLWLEDRALVLVAYGSSLKNTPYVTVVLRGLQRGPPSK